MQFRLISWNIHKGIGGLDRLYRLQRIADILERYRPDILHLQEITENVPRAHHDRQVDLLGDALALPHRLYQPNVRLSEGTYGNAILSRFPLSDAQDLDLKVSIKKRRRAQIARCRLRFDDGHTRSVILVNLHLGLAEFERRIQLRRVVDSDPVRHAHRDTPLIVAGDFNDVYGATGPHLAPAGFRNGSGGINTFPAFMPVRALDQIHFRGALQLRKCAICPSRLAARASDHLPLIADFELEPGPST